ncbi:MAG: acyltransferase [Verrucomicrobiota bacterium]
MLSSSADESFPSRSRSLNQPPVSRDSLPQIEEAAADSFPREIVPLHSSRVFGLDLLRALAIAFVFIVHGLGPLKSHLPWWAGFLGHGGFYGVELFFVLSGFLIGTIIVRSGLKMQSASNVFVFYSRRWLRTLPLFFAILLLNVFLEPVLRDRTLAAADIIRHGAFLANFSGFHMNFFGESWSLAVEEWFYLLFPAALWLSLRRTNRFDLAFVVVAMAFLLFSTGARVLSAQQLGATWFKAERMVVIYRFDAIMIGVLSAWIAARAPAAWRKYATLCVILGSLASVVLYASLWKVTNHDITWSADSFFARTFRFTFVSISFALLLPAASRWKLQRENFVSTSVRAIALWSYALYLIHTPTILLLQRYLPLAWQGSTLPATGMVLLEIALSLFLSALLYRYLESPCTHLRDRITPLRERPAPNAAVVV